MIRHRTGGLGDANTLIAPKVLSAHCLLGYVTQQGVRAQLYWYSRRTRGGGWENFITSTPNTAQTIGLYA